MPRTIVNVHTVFDEVGHVVEVQERIALEFGIVHRERVGARRGLRRRRIAAAAGGDDQQRHGGEQ